MAYWCLCRYGKRYEPGGAHRFEYGEENFHKSELEFEPNGAAVCLREWALRQEIGAGGRGSTGHLIVPFS